MKKKHLLLLELFFLSVLSVGILFFWQGHRGLSLADEGYLWYGAQRVMLGEVPLRDFLSYEPGRYYWSAALMLLQGSNGIIALRIAVALFQIIGLFVALVLIARNLKKQNFLYLLFSATILLAWMFPRHKLFDITLSILLIGILAFLIRKPKATRFFLTGLYIGLVTCFGRNHGLYGVVGTCGVLIWLRSRASFQTPLLKSLFYLTAGVIVGFSPLLLMCGLLPGFMGAFWESICFLFEAKATNISLPIPWPWLVSFSSLPLDQAVRNLLVGFFFIALLVFGVLSLCWIFLKRKHSRISPELIAAAFLALPYAHYAYSRADIGHLSQGIFPCLIGCLIILSKQSANIRWSLLFILFFLSTYLAFPYQPGWQYRNSSHSIPIIVSGSKLIVDQKTADDVELLRFLAKKYMIKGQNFLAVPFWPGAYALLECLSPMRDIYPLWPCSNKFQQKEIEKIKSLKPQFVVLLDIALDGREELRFKNTHTLIYQYISSNFEPISTSLNPNYLIYKSKF